MEILSTIPRIAKELYYFKSLPDFARTIEMLLTESLLVCSSTVVAVVVVIVVLMPMYIPSSSPSSKRYSLGSFSHF